MEELVDKIIECDFEHISFNEFPINKKDSIQYNWEHLLEIQRFWQTFHN